VLLSKHLWKQDWESVFIKRLFDIDPINIEKYNVLRMIIVKSIIFTYEKCMKVRKNFVNFLLFKLKLKD